MQLSAAMFICETVAAHPPGRVTLLALASLTNVAMAMRHDPTLAANLVRRAAVCMASHAAQCSGRSCGLWTFARRRHARCCELTKATPDRRPAAMLVEVCSGNAQV